MEKIEIAVVGSGIGGAMISALNCDKNLILFEKEPYIGGCASTFCHKGEYFNAGATTLVGLDDGDMVKKIFDKVDFKPNIIKSNIAFRVLQHGNIIDRGENFEAFLENINLVFPNKNNRLFWSYIKELDKKFWQIKEVYFAKHTIKSYLYSAKFFMAMAIKFRFALLQSADDFIAKTLGTISSDYRDFLDAGVLITVQDKTQNISLLSMALGLSYPFHQVYYANGGMGSIIDGLLNGVNLHLKEKILKIEKNANHFILHSSSKSYRSSKVILNSTIFDSSRLFSDEKIKKYYNDFEFSDKSAFVVYIKLNLKKEFLHHYQIILNTPLPYALSNAFFVSFSDISDEKLSKEGLSITLSTHTQATFWKNLSKMEYSERKNALQESIVKAFLEHFRDIHQEHIKQVFSGTSATFERFISRANCGGVSINLHNAFKLATCTTPFKNLYNVGDSVFAGQGWSGVALGVNILNRELNG